MTRDTIRASDPALAKALDTLEPPPLAHGFADRVAAAAAERGAAPLPRLRKSAPRRFGLSRGRHLAFGGAALLLAGTAAAAASGLLQRVGVDLAPVGRIVERVAAAVPGLGPDPQQPRPRPEPTELAVKRREVAVEATPLADPRRERLAQAIAARIDRRIARAEARGIAVPERLRDTGLWMDPVRAAARPERAALAERVQQIRSARQSAAPDGARTEPTGPPAVLDADLAQIAEGWAALSWRERIRLVRPLDRSERRRLFALLTPEQRAELVRRRRRDWADVGAENF